MPERVKPPTRLGSNVCGRSTELEKRRKREAGARRKAARGGRKLVTRPQKKGKAFELEVCKDVTAKLGGLADRVPCSGGLEWMKGDIFCRGNALAGWHIEAKRCESLSVPAWTRKAREQAGSHRWLVVYRRSGETAKVVLELDDLLNLLAIVQGDEGETIQPEDAEGPDTGEDA